MRCFANLQYRCDSPCELRVLKRLSHPGNWRLPVVRVDKSYWRQCPRRLKTEVTFGNQRISGAHSICLACCRSQRKSLGTRVAKCEEHYASIRDAFFVRFIGQWIPQSRKARNDCSQSLPLWQMVPVHFVPALLEVSAHSKFLRIRVRLRSFPSIVHWNWPSSVGNRWAK